METYFVYILKCSDNSYYTGVTSDLENRLVQHQSGFFPESYTHNRRPVQLVFQQEFNEINLAILFEKKLKGWSRSKKEALINNDWTELSKNSECKNESHFKNFKKDSD